MEIKFMKIGESSQDDNVSGTKSEIKISSDYYPLFGLLVGRFKYSNTAVQVINLEKEDIRDLITALNKCLEMTEEDFKLFPSFDPKVKYGNSKSSS